MQWINHGFSNPCAFNNSSFSSISIVKPSATTRPSSMSPRFFAKRLGGANVLATLELIVACFVCAMKNLVVQGIAHVEPF